MTSPFEHLLLRTPPLPRLVPDGVFDDFGWAASSVLEWRKPAGILARGEALDGSNPPRMAFVFRGEAGEFLPRELAHLHVSGLASESEWALAPYAIDDATDELWSHRLLPSEVFVLAADRLTALVWGLHDWAHFHNHGAFEQRAYTELQCDAAALVWLFVNEAQLGLAEPRPAWLETHAELVALSKKRFEEERLTFEPEWISVERLQSLASSL